MSQTDRQTDKSTWWSVTAFKDNIEKLEQASSYPTYVKKVYGGREECPKTKTIHFQGAIQCNAQVRMSAFKDWIPGVHLEPARQKDALIKYAMKEDTATGDKLERINPAKFYAADEILELIAQNALSLWTNMRYYETPDGIKDMYNDAICIMLRADRKLAGQLMNPSLRNFWVSTYKVWIAHAIAANEKDEEEVIPENEMVTGGA